MMTYDMVRFGSCLIVLLSVMVVLAEAQTPPGIAKNPSNSACTGKYKYCNNLQHVCPKFCPEGACTVHCQSCKPICTQPLTPPDEGGDTPSPTIPSTPTTPSTPSTPTTPSTPSTPTTPSSHGPYPPTPSTPTTPTTPTTPSTPTNPTTPSTPTPTPKPSTPTTPTPTPTPSTPSVPSTPTTPTPTTPAPTPSTPSTPSTPTTPTPSTPSNPTTPTPSTPSTPATPTTPTPSTPSTPATPTPSTPSTPATPSSGYSPKKAKCKDQKYTHCYNMEHVCPKSCSGGCEVDCVTCKAFCRCDKPGGVCQDPRFIGGDGITFYFHGRKNRDFCLLSDSNLHINAHFIGKRNQNMKRDFTWVQSIGVLFDTHQIYVAAQKTATWDDSLDRVALSYDGEPIFLPESEGAKWQSTSSPIVSITRSRETNSIVVEVEGNFKITANVVPITQEDSRIHNYDITKDDCFAHLDLGFKFYSLTDDVNGVLGQTYGKEYVSKIKMGTTMPVLGGYKEFVTSSIFAKDCSVARFIGESSSSSSNSGDSSEYASLSCSSGMDGRGVVCKR